MGTKDDIIKILQKKLGFSGLRNSSDLGKMRQATLEKKINIERDKLTVGNVATIYNMWLQEQKGPFQKAHEIMVKTYCKCLESFHCQPSAIAMLWNECAADALKTAADAREEKQLKDYMDRIADEIQIHFKKVKPAGKGKAVSSVGSCQPVAASATKGTMATALNPNPKPPNTRQPPRIDSNIKESPHFGVDKASTKLHTFLAAPQATVKSRQPEPILIDLTKDSWETGPAQPLVLQHNDEWDETMPPPSSYVCHRCNCRGHYIAACPTNSDPLFDSRPSIGYICHICGAKGDHFITSCPNKDPGFWIKKKTFFLPPEDNGGVRRGPPPPLWASTGLGSPRMGNRSEATNHTTRTFSGHVRKRSDDVEDLSHRAKKQKADTENDPGPSRRPTWVLLPQDGPVPPSEGRLTPWAEESGVHTGARQFDDIRGSRSDRVAQLEAESFLAEITQESEERATQERFEIRTAPPHHPSAVQTPIPSRKRRKSEAGKVSSEDQEDPRPSSPDSAAPSESRDDDLMEMSYDWSSPITPRSPAPIEFLVTPKPLYKYPPYHSGVISLFHHKSNFWVQKVRRPSSLDLWEVPEHGTIARAVLQEAEVGTNAIAIGDGIHGTGVVKDEAVEDATEFVVAEDSEETSQMPEYLGLDEAS